MKQNSISKREEILPPPLAPKECDEDEQYYEVLYKEIESTILRQREDDKRRISLLSRKNKDEHSSMKVWKGFLYLSLALLTLVVTVVYSVMVN